MYYLSWFIFHDYKDCAIDSNFQYETRTCISDIIAVWYIVFIVAVTQWTTVYPVQVFLSSHVPYIYQDSILYVMNSLIYIYFY